MSNSDSASAEQLTLVQNGEFIVCENITFTPTPPVLLATASQAINTMRPVSVRLNNEIVPLHTITSQERKVHTKKVRIDGEIAAQVAESIGLVKPSSSPKKA